LNYTRARALYETPAVDAIRSARRDRSPSFGASGRPHPGHPASHDRQGWPAATSRWRRPSGSSLMPPPFPSQQRSRTSEPAALPWRTA